MSKQAVGDVPSVKFRPSTQDDFYATLKRRVDDYFKTRQRGRYGNAELWRKAAGLVVCYVACYALVLSGLGGWPGTVAAYALLGAIVSLIGFNIAHDALHGSFCQSRRANRWVGYFFDFNGMSSYIWMISHNLHHHTYTNIPGVDEDIDKMIWLRLSPSDGRYCYHRFQHWYAFALYTMTSLNWIWLSDYVWLVRAWRRRSVAAGDAALFFLFKALYYAIFVALPIYVLPWPWWQTFLGYVAMQAVGGFISAIVFQMAHLVEGLEYPLPDGQGKIADPWALHELKTTSNFAPESPWFSWLIGGLNYQIEHHLFPHVSHVHYRALARITRATAAEYGMPYHCQPSFAQAVRSHVRHLRKLGRGEL